MLNSSLERFLRSIPSVGTRSTYERNLQMLFVKHPNPTLRDIEDWVAEQREKLDKRGNRVVTESTIKNRLAALRSYLKFCDTREARLLYSALAKIRVTPTKPRITIPADKAVEDAIEKAKRDPYDHLLLVLLTDLGLRVSEALGIRQCDVDMARKRVYIKGKGGDYNAMYITTRVQNALKVVAKLGHKHPETTIFPWCYDAAYARVQKYLRTSPHKLRHVAGTRMQKAHHDLALTQRFLRHKNVQATMVYIDLAGDDVENAMREVERRGAR